MNGTHYSEKTPPAVRRALEKARTHGLLVRLLLGDPETSRVWLEENDVVGFIGRSTGTMKVPLLVEALLDSAGQIVHDDGGPRLLDAYILCIIDCKTGHDLYRNPKITLPILELTPFKPEREMSEQERKECESPEWQTDDGGAAFKSYREGLEYIAFVQGVKTHMPLRTVEQARKEEAENAEAEG